MSGYAPVSLGSSIVYLVILSKAKDLSTPESPHSFAFVCCGFECEVPHFVRDDQMGDALRDLSGRRSFFGQFHGPFELRRFFFDAEIIGIEIVDPRHVVAGERRTLGGFGEFNELLFVIDIGQRRSRAIVCQ